MILDYVFGITMGLILIYTTHPESREVVGPVSFVKFICEENRRNRRYSNLLVVPMAAFCWVFINYVAIPILIIRELLLNPSKFMDEVLRKDK